MVNKEILREGTQVECEHGFTIITWKDDDTALVCADDGWGVIELTEADIEDRMAASEEVVIRHHKP